MFNKCLIWPQCLKCVEKILIFDCAGQKSDEIVAHGKHWLSRHFEVMPGEGGVSNYAFPVPWPGRRDHCSIQVPPWLMLTMAWWWYLGKTSHNKNRYLSGIAQITSPPHPLPPIWASCTTFFGRQKWRLARITDQVTMITTMMWVIIVIIMMVLLMILVLKMTKK